MPLSPESSVRDIKGIGPKKEELFSRLDIRTVEELFFTFPRTYRRYPDPVDLSKPPADGKYPHTTLCLRLEKPPLLRRTAKMDILLARGFSGQTRVELAWYRTPYVRNSLTMGEPLFFHGTLLVERGRLSMDQAEICHRKEYSALQKNLWPVYPLTAGLSNTVFSQTVRTALEALYKETETGEDPIPETLRKKHALMPRGDALWGMHFPESEEVWSEAKRRMAYEEFFLFLTDLYRHSPQTRAANAHPVTDVQALPGLIRRMPFELTEGQKKAAADIWSDLSSPYVSQRLIQGDVGCGKTAVAFLAMALVASDGGQAALMVPTEVLAVQHTGTFRELLSACGLNLPLYLLTGSTPAAERRHVLSQLASKGGALVIGTHTLIQEAVRFSDLRLVVTDEQHRFGVKQRSALVKKGKSAHLVVMSATPIPRTLSMILYGQMQVSVIPDLPQNRLAVPVAVLTQRERPKAFRFLKKQLDEGHQAYVICPLVAPSEEMTEAQNVSEYTAMLSETLGSGYAVSALHGQMRAEEKNDILMRFSRGAVQVLVSTTVVEVGINVPNATLMMVENAERFGLATLHQLRGRVGRGQSQSFCILMNAGNSPAAGERLAALARSKDGFEIARQDLKLRGPGDYLGVRQSGEMGFRVADVLTDKELLELASADVRALLDRDPGLSEPGHQCLAKVLARRSLQENVVL